MLLRGLGAADYHAGRTAADLATAPAFAVDWSATNPLACDVSFLLEAPAGRAGHIVIKNGHLAHPDGRRFRIWGINATGPGGLPAQTNAARIAARLAQSGINCVRFHFLDRPAPSGVLAAQRDDTRALDPAQMDRLDYFIAELKRRGIYSDLNLNVGRSYKPGDGVKDHELLSFAKALTFFDPRLLELQREYARQLLTHFNPYTRSTYAQEPAVALVEFVNENSLVEAWMDGRLRGRNTRKNPGTWTDIPASYAADLTARFNDWLSKKYSPETLKMWRERDNLPADAPIPRLEPSQFAKAPADRFHAEAEFYLEIERAFFTGMAKFLREELGVKALFAGNSDHGHHRTGYPQLAGTSLLDVVDGHVYWQHPNYQTDPQTGRQIGFTIANTPMVDDPRNSTVVQLSRSAFAGKPYTVSEVNHPFPNEYACEGIPILAAYAAFQDWDGLFWYTLAHREVTALAAKMAGHFDLAPDPVKMAQLPAGALMFLRGDVQPARETVTRTYTREQVRESIRLPYKERPYFTPGFPPVLPLLHGSRIASLDGPATRPISSAAGNRFESDTKELAWSCEGKGSGAVIVDTERSQAVIGFLTGARVKNLSAKQSLLVDANRPAPFGAITLSALDDRPIARSSKLLLTLAARVANSDMTWNAARTSLEKWGNAPTRIEPLSALVAVQLAGLTGARQVWVAPLDGAGQAGTARTEATQQNGQWALKLDGAALAYLITVVREP